MIPVFADTFYFLALLDSREPSHAKAAHASRDDRFRFVTTEWVLTEFADAYCHPNDRADFVAMYRSIVKHPRFKIVPAETRLFQRGLDFYSRRGDKKWSLTDCISFVVMRGQHITIALTGDRDFEQAGFMALLK